MKRSKKLGLTGFTSPRRLKLWPAISTSPSSSFLIGFWRSPNRPKPRTLRGVWREARSNRERRRRDLNPRSPYGDSTLAGWCTRPDYATSPKRCLRFAQGTTISSVGTSAEPRTFHHPLFDPRAPPPQHCQFLQQALPGLLHPLG